MLFSWKMDQTIWYRSTGDEEGEVFQNFELFPQFNIDVQPGLVKINFNDEKESLISSKKCNWTLPKISEDFFENFKKS